MAVATRASRASAPRRSTSWPSSPRTTSAPGSSRARPTTSGCSRSRWRRSSPRSPSGFEAPRHPAPGRPRSGRSSGSTATPGSPRTSRRTRPTWARTSRGSRADPDTAIPTASTATAAYFNLEPGKTTSAAGCGWPEGRPRRLPPGHRRRPRRGSARRSRIRLPRRVRAGRQPRPAQARPARLPGRPPDGRAVPLQGHRLRATAGRRRGRAPPTCRTSWPTPTRPAMPVFRFLATLG